MKKMHDFGNNGESLKIKNWMWLIIIVMLA